MAKLHKFFKGIGEGVPIPEACRQAGMEGAEKGPYGWILTEAVVLYRADQALSRYMESGEGSLADLAEEALSPGLEKSPRSQNQAVKYLGNMKMGIDTIRKYARAMKKMKPEDVFERVFGLPAGNVGVDYNGWALGFYVGEDEFVMLKQGEGLSETENISGLILEGAPVEGELKGKTVAVKWGEQQHERMEHERQHLRLFSMGRDYRTGMEGAIRMGSVELFVEAYKARLVDELICCLASGMPFEQTLDLMNTEFRRMQELLRKGIVPGKDVFRHVSAGPLDKEDLAVENRATVELLVQTGNTLPREYLVPFLLNTDYDNVQMELLRSEKAFR